MTLRGIAQIYEKIISLHAVANTSVYYLEDDAETILKDMTRDHIMEINQALKDGEVTPHTKKCDIIPRMAVAMHILQTVTKALLENQEIDSIQPGITSNTLQKAIEYVNHLEEQKETFLTVSDSFIHFDSGIYRKQIFAIDACFLRMVWPSSMVHFM
eukprot:Seg4296.3 transcript_id=Seg4296.3/GoldUCD/mRNA.D3Y31 product="hypothetical protein" protein_id=Seg4296.3/GoldUCD/D3Y31